MLPGCAPQLVSLHPLPPGENFVLVGSVCGCPLVLDADVVGPVRCPQRLPGDGALLGTISRLRLRVASQTAKARGGRLPVWGQTGSVPTAHTGAVPGKADTACSKLWVGLRADKTLLTKTGDKTISYHFVPTRAPSVKKTKSQKSQRKVTTIRK